MACGQVRECESHVYCNLLPKANDLVVSNTISTFFAANDLDGARFLEQVRKLLLLRLELRVSSDVLLCDEDVGDSGLTGHVAEGRLDRGAII